MACHGREPFSTDTILNGRLRVRQQRRGYRFSIDALLLADFARPHPGDTVLDLGTGCGIISMILAYRHPRIRVRGVEIQPELAELAVANIDENGMTGRVAVLQADMREITADRLSGPADVVVSNPPYRRPCSGKVNPDGQRALARHEIAITLAELLQASGRLLKNGGRFVTVYPAERLAELMRRMLAERIEPKRVRTVHSRRASDAKLVLVEGLKHGRPGVTVHAPLVLYDDEGEYTSEVKRMLAP
jgi:tRNA1Val (adenine37-N6)-methyltransferase